MSIARCLLVVVLLTGAPSVVFAQSAERIVLPMAVVQQNISAGQCFVRIDRRNSAIVAGGKASASERKSAGRKLYRNAFDRCMSGIPVASARVTISGIAGTFLHENADYLLGKAGDPIGATPTSDEDTPSEKFAACVVDKDPKSAIGLFESDYGGEVEARAARSLIATEKGCGQLPDDLRQTNYLRAEVVIALYRRAEKVAS